MSYMDHEELKNNLIKKYIEITISKRVGIVSDIFTYRRFESDMDLYLRSHIKGGHEKDDIHRIFNEGKFPMIHNKPEILDDLQKFANDIESTDDLGSVAEKYSLGVDRLSAALRKAMDQRGININGQKRRPLI